MSAPTDNRDSSDPGDEVLRKFRYQHAYGAILAIGIATKKLSYTAIWCEQHEDFLAERDGGGFDAYQIKTRKSELGEWQINDEAWHKSVGRFIALDELFPNQIRRFKFVSNTHFSDSGAKKSEQFSPVRLLKAILAAPTWHGLVGEVKTGFEWLKGKLTVREDRLFAVLKRTDLIVGPTERDCEDALCQTHISTLEECRLLNAPALKQVMETLIAALAEAASLVSSDPSRHWIGLTMTAQPDPYLMAKRFTKDHVLLVVRDFREASFRYLPSLASLELGKASGKLDTLKKKLAKGGLAGRYELLRRRSLSAEQKLLDLATRPDQGKGVCSQIENVVLAECDEAHLRASQTPAPFGATMLIDVQDRLRRIAETEPTKVCRQPYDLLVGVSGLLTSECKVWWSEQFSMEEPE
jgi:hypothetical protein